MRRLAPLIAALMVAGCGQTPGADAPLPTDFALNSTSITLPGEPASLPESAALVSVTCTACHSGEMILAQPPLDAAKWQAVIDKMRGAFKASIDPADDAKLVAELIALQAADGTPAAGTPATR